MTKPEPVSYFTPKSDKVLDLSEFKPGQTVPQPERRAVDIVAKETGFARHDQVVAEKPRKVRGAGGETQALSFSLSRDYHAKLVAFCAARYNISYRQAVELLLDHWEKTEGQIIP